MDRASGNSSGSSGNPVKNSKPLLFLKLSQLVRWKSYLNGETFGFTFMTLRDTVSGMPVHFVGKIEASSPAFYSGLREYDQILQLNGTDVTNMPHKHVQTLVRETEERISILTGDKASIRHINDNGFLISDTSRDYVVQYSSPALEPVEEVEKGRSSMYRRFSLTATSESKASTSPRLMRKRVVPSASALPSKLQEER